MKSMRGQTGARSPLGIAISATVVLGSVLGVWFFIESNKTTEIYLVTKQDLPSGAAINLESLEQVELSLFGLGQLYLQPETLVEGAYLGRAVAAGEAIPVSAITNQADDNWANVVVTPEVQISTQLSTGSKVAIWAAPLIEFQTYGEPALLAVDVEVVAIIEPQGGFTGQSKAVELKVPKESIQFLLGAISNKASIALTASAGSL